MQLGITTEDFFVGDQSWIGSKHYGEPQSITIDLASLTEATHYPNGFILSGLPLQLDAGTGRYVLATTRVDGFLFSEISLRGGTGNNPSGALFWHGRVRRNRLPVTISDALATSNPQITVAAA